MSIARINRPIIWLLGIMLAGLVIRVWDVGRLPVSTYWDETAIGYDAWSIATKGTDMHGNKWWQPIFPSYGDYKLPLYIWLTAGIFKIAGPTVIALRLTSVMAGTLMIGVIYLIAKEITNNDRLGVWAALTIAIMPWSIHFSRAAFEGHLASFCFSVIILFLFKSLKQPYYYLLAALAGGLAVYSYYSTMYLVPIMFGVFVIMGWEKITKKHLAYLVIAISIFFLLVSPIWNSPYFEAMSQFRLSTPSLLNTDNHIQEQNLNRAWSNNSLVSRLVYHRYVILGKSLMENLASHITFDYLFSKGDINLRHGTGHTGLGYPVLMPFLLIGLYAGVKKYLKHTLILIVIWLLTLIPASIPLEVPHALRSLNAIVPFAIFIGWGIYYWMNNFSLIRLEWRAALLMPALTVSFGFYWHNYTNHYRGASAEAWHYSNTQVANYLRGEVSEYKQVNIYASDQRLFLYPLFYQAISPRSLTGADNYHYFSYENLNFSQMPIGQLDKLSTDQLYIVEASKLEDLKAPYEVVDVISDYSGQSRFMVITSYE